MNHTDISSIMEMLYTHRAPALPPKGLAEVFDRLIWCLDDQGASLLRVREEWLVSGDRARVEIALAMDEAFPFDTSAEMTKVFSRISARWPELSGACERVQASRAAIESA